MTKQEAYKILFNLEDKGIDTSEYIDDLAINKNVSNKVISFINSFNDKKLDFLNNLKSKKFYKNLQKENLTINEKAKTLSSFVTHVLIEKEINPDVDLNLLDIEKINESLTNYIKDNNEKEVNDSFNYIKSLID